MSFFRSVAMAFSMFSRIPMPRIKWEPRNMRYAMAALSLVGAVIGLVLWSWVFAGQLLAFSPLLFSAGLTLIPVLITGGIHLDGYADTADALASRAPIEKKREILKDPHAGAFAIISLCVYFLLYFALCAGFEPVYQTAILLALVHCVSRTLGGLATLLLPSAKSGGLLDTFEQAANKRAVALLAIEGVLFLAVAIWANIAAGLAIATAGGLCFLYVALMSKKQFGGMSGDLSGYLIQLSELTMVAAVVLAQKGVALWF